MEDEFTTTEKGKEVVYKLFLDTREQTSYIAYESTYVNKENNEISRDEYLALPSTSRSNYTLKDLKLTNELIDINSMLTTITDYFSKFLVKKIVFMHIDQLRSLYFNYRNIFSAL